MGKLLTLVKAICFKGQKGDKGDPGVSVSVGSTVTGDPGMPAAVENVGTASDPVLNFTIPQGETGVSIANIAKTSTSGNVDTYTITMTDGTTYTFTVRNGEHKQAYISQAAYNALVAAGTVDPECYYYIIDDHTGEEIAAEIAALGEGVETLQNQLDFATNSTLLNGFHLGLRFVDGSREVSNMLPSGGLYVFHITGNDPRSLDPVIEHSVVMYYSKRESQSRSGAFLFARWVGDYASTRSDNAFISVDYNGYISLFAENDAIEFDWYTIWYRKIG